jgi:peptidoglycan/xylan/chitin deacetylase (PgdA/CDA1 family)
MPLARNDFQCCIVTLFSGGRGTCGSDSCLSPRQPGAHRLYDRHDRAFQRANRSALEKPFFGDSTRKVHRLEVGKGTPPPPRSVVLTFDDGHISVYREARLILTTNRIPVTLFIYPSCISRASYAMTWEELSELAGTPYFRIESHTFWHPNFKQESKKLDQAAYTTLVDTQLRHSKALLEERFKRPVEFLAWPFGVYDQYLMNRASAAGYRAAFTIECRAATMSDPIMALPRCLVSDQDIGPCFLRFLDSAIRTAKN